jgi:hypothetical protein
MASEELLAAGVAIDALFAFIDSDKLKLVRRKTKLRNETSGVSPLCSPSF